LKTDEGPDTKANFLAICSPPSQTGIFSFLIKETDSNAALTGAQPGSSVLVTRPAGGGFKVADAFEGYRNDFPVSNVLLLACGSGLAPVASAIESGILGIGSTGVTSLFPRGGTLYIGAKTPLHLPLQSRYAAWESAGLKVVPVLSQTSDPACTDWTGATGYVQDQLKKDGVNVPKNSAALLCGMRGMTVSVVAVALICT
jgi:NAD(P)H-flavin reductase